MVVYIHSFGEPKVIDTFSIDYLHPSLFDVYNLIRVAITQVITHCAVPIFYIISGYLFYQKLSIWNFEVWKQKMKKRIKTVGLPYIVWITIMIIYNVAMLTAGCLLHGKPWSRIIEWFSSHGWWHLFWDCHIWNLDRLNLIGLPMPASAHIGSILVYARPYHSACNNSDDLLGNKETKVPICDTFGCKLYHWCLDSTIGTLY